MKRYYLQEGDCVHVIDPRGLMLVVTGGHLALSAFDARTMHLAFPWGATQYATSLDERGYFIEVGEDTYRELCGGGEAEPTTFPDQPFTSR